MAIKLLIANSDITQLLQTATWSGDYTQCGRTLECSIISSPTDKNIPVATCELGNHVVFMQDDRILFDGFLFARSKSTDSSTIDITCFDRGIYLKRNKAAYKFSNMTAESIARRICTDFNIPIGSLAATGIKISRNLIGVSLYEMIQTAYTIASASNGKKYYLRFDGASLHVVEKAVTAETMIIEGGSNLMSASTSESIENMINQVVIYSSEDKQIGIQKNQEAIKLYGLLQSYLRQTEGEDAEKKAKEILADYGINQKITVENLGNIANITGGTVVVREPYTGLYGLFYIDSDIHTWKNGLYLNKLVLNFRNIMDNKEAGSLVNKDGSKTATSDSGDAWTYTNKK